MKGLHFLRDLKLKWKIGAGFTIVLLLTVLVAYTGWKGMRNIEERKVKSDNLAEIVHQLLQAREAEKNYIIYGDGDDIEKVGKNVKEIYRLADTTKGIFEDQADKDQMDVVKKEISVYETDFKEYVDLESRKQVKLSEMMEKANAALEKCREISRDQNRQLEESRKESDLVVKSALARAGGANSIIRWFLEIRKFEKEFIISKGKKEWGDKHRETMQKLQELAADLRSRTDTEGGVERLDEITSGLSEYQAGFKQYSELMDAQDEIMKNMRIKSDVALTECEAIHAAYAELVLGPQSTVDSSLQERLEKADDANRIIKWFLDARKLEKEFIISNGGAEWKKKHTKRMEEITALAGELQSELRVQANLAQIEKVLTALQDYRESFNNYEAMLLKERDQMDEIRNQAERILELSERYRANQEKLLIEARSNAEAFLKDKIAKASDAALIIEWFQRVRINEKEYIGSGQEQHHEQVKEMIRQVLDLSDKLTARFLLEKNIEQGRALITSVKAYSRAFIELSELIRRQNESNEHMLRAAVDAMKTCDQVAEGQKIKMEDEISSANQIILLVSIVSILAGVLMSLFIISAITGPIKKIVQFTKEFGRGNLQAELDIQSKDEIGEMAEDLNLSVKNLTEIIRELMSTTENLTKSAESLSSVSSQMAQNAEEMNAQATSVAASSEEISSGVSTVAASAEEASATVTNIASMTEEMSAAVKNVADAGRKTSVNANMMASSSDEMSDQVNRIASSIEEMTASLNEVSRNTAQGSRISSDANKMTERINSRMDVLVASSKKIGKIVSVIKDIADQTNMLALNATIEASGAGEAGKGFAVVAGEVKELAKQSADASDEIASQIDDIQVSTEEAVASIKEINQVIEQIAAINETIASAIEEQTATAGEISRSVVDTAGNVKDVAQKAGESAVLMDEVAKSTVETSKTAGEVSRNIDELSTTVKEVARSSSEASGGVNNISKTIQEISKASVETSSGASQTHDSSRELANIAAALTKIVGRFRI